MVIMRLPQSELLLIFSFTSQAVASFEGSSVTAEWSPQRWMPEPGSKLPLKKVVLVKPAVPDVIWGSALNLPDKRTCALTPIRASVDVQVTKQLPAVLAVMDALKSSDVPLAW